MHPHTTVSGNTLSAVGIGSYGIGGRGHRDMEITETYDDSIYLEALLSSFALGQNFTELSVGYGKGATITIFALALMERTLSREDLFLTHALYPRDLRTLWDIKQDTETFFRTLSTDYADSTLVTQSLILTFGETAVYHYLLKFEEKRAGSGEQSLYAKKLFLWIAGYCSVYSAYYIV